MAKNTSLIHLATAFLAVIGGNAAILTAYILIYPSITGNSPSEHNIARSSDTAVTQSDVFTDETAYAFPDTEQSTRTVPENQENIIANNTLLDHTVAGYDPAKQDIFNNLAQERQRSENQERQLSEPEQNTLDNYMPAQNTQETYVSVQDSQEIYTPIQSVQEAPVAAQEAYIPVQSAQEAPVVAQETQKVRTPVQNTQEAPAPLPNTQNTIIPESGTYEADSQGDVENSTFTSSGDASRFNTYNNTHLQQTTASYVINTNTGKFHIPSCRYVAKMAEKNYLESNSSFEELRKDYSPCGHCLD